MSINVTENERKKRKEPEIELKKKTRDPHRVFLDFFTIGRVFLVLSRRFQF